MEKAKEIYTETANGFVYSIMHFPGDDKYVVHVAEIEKMKNAIIRIPEFGVFDSEEAARERLDSIQDTHSAVLKTTEEYRGTLEKLGKE